ncbi:hypothetical protein LYSHEL_05470 [Lysobacter helvus]|uniref:DUF3619 family protein n=2 Tax=Lysobacteraceae TaxID=32033 RepID=A0ABM7Q2S6_9GAMM|nr:MULTISPECIES: hypothetical protein [Lysobacter]BCT91523.1 hypothetical protein LYSCAS_05470 [Lysobacter caseinilyticus]BCT94676.1 hypothetical protein LYSHEL_05470 [Lysobacter helvus]
MSTHENENARDAAFDAAMREAHVASLDHLSPRVRAQLVQRRRTALAGNARKTAHPLRAAWPLAAAFAIGALAIGLSVRTPTPAPATVAATAPTDAATTYDTLDENPDLYVWLASDDAASLAME